MEDHLVRQCVADGVLRAKEQGVVFFARKTSFVWEWFVRMMTVYLRREHGVTSFSTRKQDAPKGLVVTPFRNVGRVIHCHYIWGVCVDCVAHYGLGRPGENWKVFTMPTILILDWSPAQVSLWHDNGVRATLFPTTWTMGLGDGAPLSISPPGDAEFAFDVALVAHHSGRRSGIMRALAEAGIRTRRNERLFGRRKAEALRDVSILLHIGYKDIESPVPFPLHRVIDYAQSCPNGFVCVSDPFDDEEWGEEMPWVVSAGGTSPACFEKTVKSLLCNRSRLEDLRRQSREWHAAHIATARFPDWCLPDFVATRELRLGMPATVSRKLASRLRGVRGYHYLDQVVPKDVSFGVDEDGVDVCIVTSKEASDSGDNTFRVEEWPDVVVILFHKEIAWKRMRVESLIHILAPHE